MMDLTEFLFLAEEYSKLGGAVQEQLVAIEQGEPKEDQNANALDMVRCFLNQAADLVDGAGDLAEELNEYLDENDFNVLGF